MNQETNKRPAMQTLNMPFRAKSAGVSFIAISMIAIYYVANARGLLSSNEAIPDGALSLIISTVILLIVVEIVLQIVLFIGAGEIESRTEHDNAVAMRSTHKAYWVLLPGVFAAIGSLFADATPFVMGNILFLSLFAAELVKFASQVSDYRAGVSTIEALDLQP